MAFHQFHGGPGNLIGFGSAQLCFYIARHQSFPRTGRRKFYAPTASGVSALRQAYRAFTAMTVGLERRLETK